MNQKELKEILYYDPDTGIFTWKDRDGARRPNKTVGCIGNGYIAINVNKKQYRAHRLAWLYVYGEWPKYQIDHINHIRSDNRIENLRDVISRDNQRNRSSSKNNSSGFPGVSFHKNTKKYRAQIGVDGKRLHLGYFDCPKKASKCYEAAKEKYGYSKTHGNSKQSR